jgi:16S rRNA processing protein RimM
MAATPAGADPDLPWPEDAIEVARIVGAWGIAGGLKLKAYAGDPQALFSTKRWFLQPAEPVAGVAIRPARLAAAPMPRLLRVIKAREQGDLLVATVAEINDRDAAEALKGARVFVSRGSFPSLGEDEFYWVDLIGMTVVNRAQQTLGNVVGLIETGPHCVLRIQQPRLATAVANDQGDQDSAVKPARKNAKKVKDDNDGPDEVLIPFVGVYVDAVDKAQRRILVDWDFDAD